jgi:hypothetical protein
MRRLWPTEGWLRQKKSMIITCTVRAVKGFIILEISLGDEIFTVCSDVM